MFTASGYKMAPINRKQYSVAQPVFFINPASSNFCYSATTTTTTEPLCTQFVPIFFTVSHMTGSLSTIGVCLYLSKLHLTVLQLFVVFVLLLFVIFGC